MWARSLVFARSFSLLRVSSSFVFRFAHGKSPERENERARPLSCRRVCNTAVVVFANFLVADYRPLSADSLSVSATRAQGRLEHTYIYLFIESQRARAPSPLRVRHITCVRARVRRLAHTRAYVRAHTVRTRRRSERGTASRNGRRVCMPTDVGFVEKKARRRARAFSRVRSPEEKILLKLEIYKLAIFYQNISKGHCDIKIVAIVEEFLHGSRIH